MSTTMFLDYGTGSAARLARGVRAAVELLGTNTTEVYVADRAESPYRADARQRSRR